VEDAVRAACPGEASVWQSSEAPFEEVVKAMESPGVVLLVDADTPRKLRRARWARAAACRTTRLVLVVGEQDAPGFWPVDDRQMSLAEGCKLLGAAGARTPGRLSALVDLEPDAVRFLASWLKAADEGGSLTTEERMDRLFSMLLPGGGLGDPAALVAAIEALDPGVAIALLALTAAEKKSYFDARSPKLVGERSALRFRAMATRPRVRDAFLAWARTAEPNGAPELGVAVAHSPTRSRDLYLAGLKQDFEKVGRDDWWVETVFRLRPSAPFELLLGAVVELAILGEGDVIAWFLHLVQDPDVQRVLRPVHQRASSEKEPEALLDLLRPAVASLKAEWNRRAALWATVNVLLSGAAAFSLGGGLAAYLTDYGAWVLIPTAVATLSLLWASVVAKKRAVPAWARSAVPGNDLQRRFRAIEARFPPTRTAMEGQLRERLLAIEKKIDSEELAEAEKLARQALLEVRLLEGTAPHQAAAQALASILLARGNRSEATKLIEPFFTGRTAPLTKGLLAFAARLLAETGRATLAVRSLLHLTSATLPTVSNLRAIPESLGEEDVLASRLLSEPRGVLAELPEAHATLVDALLKQGRYPEALVVARAATTKFAGRKGKVVSELAIRTVDLERRIGAVAPAVQGSP
jgi:hypothetical protein